MDPRVLAKVSRFRFRFRDVLQYSGVSSCIKTRPPFGGLVIFHSSEIVEAFFLVFLDSATEKSACKPNHDVTLGRR